MKIRLALAFGLATMVSPVFSGQAQQGERTEPFGLRMGMAKAEVIASVGPNSVETDLGDVLMLTTAPKPDANFARYIVLVPPETGVAKVVGVSCDITTSSSGESLQNKFNEFRASLEADYGKATVVFDFLVPGSTWNEPSDWMMALLNYERTLLVGWEPDEQGVSVTERARAISAETGYVTVTYEFPNFLLWEQERRNKNHHFRPVEAHRLMARTDTRLPNESADVG
jgi:hypothetical protein